MSDALFWVYILRDSWRVRVGYFFGWDRGILDEVGWLGMIDIFAFGTGWCRLWVLFLLLSLRGMSKTLSFFESSNKLSSIISNLDRADGPSSGGVTYILFEPGNWHTTLFQLFLQFGHF